MLSSNIAAGILKLSPQDLMRYVCPAWEAAFSAENILKSFRATGIVPFSRCVLFTLIEEEKRASAKREQTDHVDYTRLTVAQFAGRRDAGNDDNDDDEHNRLVAKGRISSADLYSLGPITSDKVCDCVCSLACLTHTHTRCAQVFNIVRARGPPLTRRPRGRKSLSPTAVGTRRC